MENGNAVVKKVCHSRKFLSGIFHVLICYVHKGKSLFINDQYIEDPRVLRTAKSEMTPLFNNSAFTLIELLVTVLIIGILAAVALPQYQKAVKKSRYTQLQTMCKSIANAQETYYLANAEYTDDPDKLDINLPSTQTAPPAGAYAHIYFNGGYFADLSNPDYVVCGHNDENGNADLARFIIVYQRSTHAKYLPSQRYCYWDIDLCKSLGGTLAPKFSNTYLLP